MNLFSVMATMIGQLLADPSAIVLLIGLIAMLRVKVGTGRWISLLSTAVVVAFVASIIPLVVAYLRLASIEHGASTGKMLALLGGVRGWLMSIAWALVVATALRRQSSVTPKS